MIKIQELIDIDIINREFELYSDDAKFIDNNGEIQVGTWMLEKIDNNVEPTHQLTDELSEEEIFKERAQIALKNNKGNICIVGLFFTPSACKNCGWTYQSYHCMDCNSYRGRIEEIKPFCPYCNHTYGEKCENCEWKQLIKERG